MGIRCKLLIIIGLFWAVFPLLAQGYQESTLYLPELNTSETLKTLDKSFNKTIPLIKTFEQASQKLDELLSEYKENPTIELEGKLEKELSLYASRIVELIDNFEGDRDEIIWALTEIERDVEKFKKRLASQQDGVKQTLQIHQKGLEDIEKELGKLARQIKADPENKKLRKDFKEKLTALRFQERKLAGYRNNEKTMETWAGSLVKLSEAVTVVKTQVADLLDSLEQEKGILAVAVDFRSQRANIVGQLSGGLVGEGAVLRGLADKIRTLYESIDKFAQVTEEMDVNLGKESAVNKAVSDIAESAGKGGIVPMQNERQLDTAIDFYVDK